MKPLLINSLVAIALVALALCAQSCSEQGVQLENQKVKFNLSVAGENAGEINLPENSMARISIASSSGVPILTDEEVQVVNRDGLYITDPIDLTSGSYIITDFMIVSDSEDLYVTPKQGAEFATSLSDALPYKFSLGEADASTLDLRVLDVRNQDLKKFGYTSSKGRANSLSIAVYENTGGSTSLTGATVELRQNKELLNVFSLTAAVNTINFGGDSKLPYSITVYSARGAKTRTFDIKQLKKELGKTPLAITLEPALVLTMHSSVDEPNEYEEYFNLNMEGSGSVSINWGDGYESAATLPFEFSHEYFSGNYTAIVTGDIAQITDFFGFSYGTIIYAITGLTNLTSLKVYDPSWGAVPIKVDLSNCKQLERINIAKYGAPYEPCDLRTEFKLPTEHYINSFTMDATSFDSGREFISAEELEVMFNNIYSNAINRGIHNGEFLLNPVVAPAPETQEKIDILINDYDWAVRFNEDIYSFDAGRSRSTLDADEKREQWLRARFSNSEKIIARARVFASAN